MIFPITQRYEGPDISEKILCPLSKGYLIAFLRVFLYSDFINDCVLSRSREL